MIYYSQLLINIYESVVAHGLDSPIIKVTSSNGSLKSPSIIFENAESQPTDIVAIFPDVEAQTVRTKGNV